LIVAYLRSREDLEARRRGRRESRTWFDLSIDRNIFQEPGTGRAWEEEKGHRERMKWFE
jgi:hypothetical protein